MLFLFREILRIFSPIIAPMLAIAAVGLIWMLLEANSIRLPRIFIYITIACLIAYYVFGIGETVRRLTGKRKK